MVSSLGEKPSVFEDSDYGVFPWQTRWAWLESLGLRGGQETVRVTVRLWLETTDLYNSMAQVQEAS